MRSELNLDRDREMIGRLRAAKHLGILKLDRSTSEDPVQRSDYYVRPDLSIAKSAAVSGLPKARNHRRGADLGVEVAGHDHRSVWRVALRVGQDFVELQEPAMLAASAFQMKIVNHQRLAAVVEFSDQRSPSALTP